MFGEKERCESQMGPVSMAMNGLMVTRREFTTVQGLERQTHKAHSTTSTVRLSALVKPEHKHGNW